jgi:outer membrane cobalamin receptor
VVAKWRPSYGPLELTATVGHKGRVPTLRERFQTGSGNAALGPEQATAAELRAVEHVGERVHVELAPFYRRVDGLVRLSPTQDMTDPTYGKLINLGLVTFVGADAIGRVRVIDRAEVGGGYSYIRARSETNGVVDDQPLDRLPHHRWEAWAQVAPAAQVSLLARVTYFGDSVNQGMTLAGYAQLGVTASWRFARDYLAVVRGDDLTRARGPETRPGVFGPGRTISVVIQGELP